MLFRSSSIPEWGRCPGGGNGNPLLYSSLENPLDRGVWRATLQCMKVKSESEVAQSCPTLSNPMNCSLPGSSDHGIFQARVLEWVAIAFSSAKLHQCPNTRGHYRLGSSCINHLPESKSVHNWKVPGEAVTISASVTLH